MAKYLISFPGAAMIVPDGEWEAVGRDAHAVIDEAKAAGVYVFGGGIDEDVPPVLVWAGVRSPRDASFRRPLGAAPPCSNLTSRDEAVAGRWPREGVPLRLQHLRVRVRPTVLESMSLSSRNRR